MKGSAKMIPWDVTRAPELAVPSTLRLARTRIGILTVLVALPAAAARAQVGEVPPKPAYADTAPVIPHEDLTKVTPPNTTVDSVELNAADGSCRVRATVTHPPTGCRVKVFVALPTKGWMGGSKGPAGGGMWGGSPIGWGGRLRRGSGAPPPQAGPEGGGGGFARG